MLAFQLDGALISLQQPVQLTYQASSRSYTATGFKGCGSLLRHTAITGCARWLPTEQQQQETGGDAGYAPGLLLVTLATIPEDCQGSAEQPVAILWHRPAQQLDSGREGQQLTRMQQGTHRGNTMADHM
jgi:hypothetical protein